MLLVQKGYIYTYKRIKRTEEIYTNIYVVKRHTVKEVVLTKIEEDKLLIKYLYHLDPQLLKIVNGLETMKEVKIIKEHY